MEKFDTKRISAVFGVEDIGVIEFEVPETQRVPGLNKGIKKGPMSQAHKEALSKSKKGRKAHNKGKVIPIALRSKRGQQFVITFPDGQEEIITNLRLWCELNGLSFGLMSRVSRGIGNHHKHYKVRKL